jgi:alkylhydroperoxidase family enzyme
MVEMTQQRNPDAPFLSPIENPKDPMLKQLYAMYESRIGLAITPVKVHSARLPSAFAQFYGKINELDRELSLSPETIQLIRHRVSQINVCPWCMDAELAGVIMASMNQAKFDAIDEYRTSPLFNEAERAALDYTSELTRDRKVSPQTFDKLALHYSERQICEIVYLVATQFLFNINNIGLNIHSDMICDIARKRRGSSLKEPQLKKHAAKEAE